MQLRSADRQRGVSHFQPISSRHDDEQRRTFKVRLHSDRFAPLQFSPFTGPSVLDGLLPSRARECAVTFEITPPFQIVSVWSARLSEGRFNLVHTAQSAACTSLRSDGCASRSEARS